MTVRTARGPCVEPLAKSVRRAPSSRRRAPTVTAPSALNRAQPPRQVERPRQRGHAVELHIGLSGKVGVGGRTDLDRAQIGVEAALQNVPAVSVDGVGERQRFAEMDAQAAVGRAPPIGRDGDAGIRRQPQMRWVRGRAMDRDDAAQPGVLARRIAQGAPRQQMQVGDRVEDRGPHQIPERAPHHEHVALKGVVGVGEFRLVRLHHLLSPGRHEDQLRRHIVLLAGPGRLAVRPVRAARKVVARKFQRRRPDRQDVVALIVRRGRDDHRRPRRDAGQQGQPQDAGQA